MNSIIRFKENPLLTPESMQASSGDMTIEGVLNPGAFIYKDKIYLLIRVAERPKQEEGIISFPIMSFCFLRRQQCNSTKVRRAWR